MANKGSKHAFSTLVLECVYSNHSYSNATSLKLTDMKKLPKTSKPLIKLMSNCGVLANNDIILEQIKI